MEVLGGAGGAGAQSHQCFGEVLPEGQQGPGQQFAIYLGGTDRVPLSKEGLARRLPLRGTVCHVEQNSPRS